MICLIAAIALFVVAIVMGVKSGFGMFVDFFIAAEFVFFMAVFSLNLNLVGIEEKKETSAGQELIAIISFSLKSGLRSVPFIWGLGSVLCTVMLFTFVISDLEHIYENIDVLISSLVSLAILGFMPIIAYVSYLCYAFFLDVASAILSLKNKG